MSDKVPNGWKECRLEEVAKIVGGGTPKTDVDEYWNGDIPWITPKDLSNFNGRYISKGERNISEKGLVNSSAKLLPPGTILLTSRAPVGYLAIAENEITTNQGFRSLVPLNNIDNIFLFYLLKNNIEYLKSQATGTTFGELAGSVLKSLVFLFPPLPEQRAIASVLSSLDDKIDLLHRENKTLEAMAETLFRQWFIEEAKDEWEEKSLKDIYIFEKGFEPGSENYLETEEEDAIRFIRVGDMLSHTPSVYIKKSLAKSICSADDLLMSFDGTPGRLNFGIEGAYSSGIRRIYSLNPVYDNLGLKYLIFKSKHIQDTVNAHSSGTVILHASSSIDELTFSFPDERKLEEFNEMITPIFSKMQLNKRQFRILEKLRDTLLPKLMSGEVRVKYVEEEMASCRA
ncbi:MAG TPA: restriction endonuclease subunit S [Fervidobacterium sp.]|uniref:restriction endonuclease subunit S n=1 Tax=Acetomicrobium mobile TaxID=97477 RepID=UPI0026F214D3|nr:restriction endonuclease subunit S [Acetomicrobium mobile]HUM44000.1 restriction endonuclease subunit S [Fervidobacterium sp.]